MKISTGLLTGAGLLLAAQAAFAVTEPSITISRAGAPTGGTATITVNGVVPDATEGITGIQITFHLAKGQVVLPSTVTAAAGWDTPTINATATDLTVVNTNGTNSGAGQIANGPIMTFTVTNNTTGFAAGDLSIPPGNPADGSGAALSDTDFTSVYISPADVAIVNGAVRHLGAASTGSIAAGPNKVFAVGSGSTLYVLNATDPALADAAGFQGGKVLDGAISGRAAFGSAAAVPIIAVGTDAGSGYVFDATAGTQIAKVTVGGKVKKSPAITAGGDIYWAVDSASGPTLVHSRGTTTDSSSLGAAGTTVVSAPLVNNGKVLVGTSAGVKYFTADTVTGATTPAADSATGDSFTSSPVSVGGSNVLVGAASGKITLINAATGTAGASTNVGTTVSDGFFGGGKAVFGGGDGKVYTVTPDASSSTSVAFGTGQVSSPVVINGTTYAADAAGNFGPVGSPIALGNASGAAGSVVGGAIAATGVASGTDYIGVNTTDGDVAALKVP